MSEGRSSPQVAAAPHVPDDVWARPSGPPPSVVPPVVPAGVPPQPSSQLPPQPETAPAPPRPRPSRAVVLTSAVAVILGTAALAMTIVKWTQTPPAPVTTTVTASPPVYSDKQIADAKDETCAAAKAVVNKIYEASVPVVHQLADRNSPEFQSALTNEQTVVMVELEYLRIHRPAATPAEVADPARDYINATLEVLDADTRGQDRTWAAERTQTAMDRIYAACKR